MKLLFVGYLHGFGGAEKQLIMLSNEMARRGHYVYLLSLSQNNPCYSIETSVHYVFKEDKSNSKILKILERYKYLKKQLLDIQPDLIISFNVQPALMCALMSDGIAKKTIYAERGDPYDKEYSGVNGVLRKYMMKRVGGFVFQTKGARDFFAEDVKNRSAVINNPIFINTDDYPRELDLDKRIVTVGRLHEQKNQKLFIQAIANLPNKYSEYSAEIYGDGSLDKELQKQIDESGTKIKITLMGAHKDVLDRIKNASVFVLTSDYEGMPNALMEAMALGIPCVSTDCRPGGARELIQDGVDGFIVKCGDYKCICERIEEILEDEKLAETISINAKKKMGMFVSTKIYDRWEHFFLNQIKIKKG